MQIIKTIKNNIFNWWNTTDKYIVYYIGILVLVGIISILSTSFYVATRVGLDENFYVKKAILYIPFGLFLTYLISNLKIRWVKIFSISVFIPIFITLILTLFNSETKGAKRWLNIIGGYKFQPSEFLKPIFAIIIAMIIVKIQGYNKTNNILKLLKIKPARNYIILLLSIILSIILVLLLQPDIGMTLTFLIIIGAELITAGIPSKYLISLGSFILISLGIIITFKPHAINRINSFIKGSEQLSNSLKTISNSNILFGGHDNNLKRFIYDGHTDFIFSGIIEELGLIIAIIILLIFLGLLNRIYKQIYKKTNKFIIYSSTGITAFLTFQILINILSTIGIIPTKGMTLPFISYGGSSFISSCIGIGIILSLIREKY